jgi:hypothetical protein
MTTTTTTAERPIPMPDLRKGAPPFDEAQTTAGHQPPATIDEAQVREWDAAHVMRTYGRQPVTFVRGQGARCGTLRVASTSTF